MTAHSPALAPWEAQALPTGNFICPPPPCLPLHEGEAGRGSNFFRASADGPAEITK